MNYYIHLNKLGLSHKNIIVRAEPMCIDQLSKYRCAKSFLKSTKKYYTDDDIKASKGEGYFFEDTRGDYEIEGWLPKTIFEKEFSKLVIVPFDNEP